MKRAERTRFSNAIRKVVLTLANQLGKRYFCEKCGSEFIVTKGGEGTLNCCNQPMTLKK